MCSQIVAFFYKFVIQNKRLYVALYPINISLLLNIFMGFFLLTVAWTKQGNTLVKLW